jgi:PAS domain S-box-containing protein
MSLVAIVVVVHSLYISLDLVIRTSQRELEGIEIIKPFPQAIRLIQQHRGLSSVLLGGDKSIGNTRAAKEIEATEALRGIEGKLPPSLASNKDLQRIKASWEQVRKEGLNWTRDENFAAHTSLIDQVRLFEVVTADEYALTQDPEIGTYYLIDSAIQKLPNVLEHLGRIRAYGAGILAEKRATTQQKVEMSTLIAELDDVIDDLKTNLEKTGHLNPEIQGSMSVVSNNIINSAQLITSIAAADIITSHFTMRPGDFFEMATVAINNGYAQLNDSLLPMSETLLKARIARAENTLRTSIGLAFIMFLVVVYFSASICYAIIHNIKSIARSAHAFADGNLHERVHLDTRDELSQVGDSFNEMADGFSTLLEARHEDDARLRATLETALDAVVRMDASGIIIGWNGPAEKVFGWSRQEAVGRMLNETIIPPRYREAHTQGLKNFLLSGEGPVLNSRIEIVALHRDGHEFPVELSIAPTMMAGKYEFSAFIRDITERKTAEEQTLRYVAQLESAFMRTVEVATTLTEMRDPYTAGHERRVAEIAAAIGGELGLDARQIEGLRVAGQLHDIGKIGLPAEILAKPGRINDAEYTLIKGHAQAGYDALKDVGFPWPVAEVAWQHHERMDGSGYPRGLKGDEILLEARIMSVADVVEAMASTRRLRRSSAAAVLSTIRL